MNNVRAHVDSGRFHAVDMIERRSALLAWLQSAGRVEVAAALLAEGESVVLDSGTTALEVARCLTDSSVPADTAAGLRGCGVEVLPV